MKLKALAALCKANNKSAAIIKDRDRGGNLIGQYIATGSAIYPADDLPELSESLLLTIFDVPGKDWEKWTVKEEKMPEGINLNPYTEIEELLKGDVLLSLNYHFTPYRTLFTDDRTVFIDVDYLRPTDDIKEDREMYLRQTAAGRDYVVVKYGFIVQAVILAEELTTEDFIEHLGKLYNRCRTESILRKIGHESDPGSDDETDQEDIPGQMGFDDQDCDSETGEIIDLKKRSI